MQCHSPMDEVLLIADPKILAIPIVENGDHMVDLKQVNDIVFGPSPEISNNTDYTKMRYTVYKKLLEAQAMLPNGWRFCLYEAYRSLNLQKKLFDERFAKLKQQYNDWSHTDIFTETTRLISPVTNLDGSQNIPPHATGAAVDVYLLDAHGKTLDMGIHPKDWMQDTDGILSATSSDIISPQAMENRQIMNEALSAVGFINYPTEYWHWSYGDRYWAYYQPHKQAIYGAII